MQRIVDALSAKLPEGSVRLQTRAAVLSKTDADGTWILTTDQGEELEADGIILALPAYGAAETLSTMAPGLAKELQSIPYTSTATVSLAYRRSDIPKALDAFGFVVPARERRKIIACTFSSVKYPGRAPEGYDLLRAFVGGALQPSLFEQDDQAMELCVREELSALLGIQAPPVLCRVHRHPRSMPQYHIGHLDRVGRINEHLTRLTGLRLAGNAYEGVGIADCVRSGEDAAEALLASVG